MVNVPQVEVPVELEIHVADEETPAQAQAKRERNTELWGKCVIQAVLLINATLDIGIEVDDEMAVQLVAGIEAVYTIGRSVKKFGDKAGGSAARASATASRAAQTNALIASIAAAIAKQQTPAAAASPASPVTVNVDTKPKEGAAP